MAPELWRQIEELYLRALGLPPGDRASLLAQASTEVRRRVEAMLAQASGSRLIDLESWAEGPDNIRDALASEIPNQQSGNPLAKGIRFGPYEILDFIGAGGMGEVYLAKDVTLGRKVALKILPDALTLDPERLLRFGREAKVLASLNHPNIAQIYAVEQNALVMELIPGGTLRGPLPPNIALNYARQIADALEAAHEKGIIHRDLKPTNIMITTEGVAKLLDFGLAAIESPSEVSDSVTSPTLTVSPTRSGMILGTAAYMSPEQARGQAVDKRADIWSFGVVLYEMLTGMCPFKGNTILDTLAAVLSKEPDWSALPPATSLKIRWLIERCLKRDRKQRLQAIGEARIAIDESISGIPDRLGTPRRFPATVWSRWLPWTTVCFLALLIVLFAFLYLHQKSPISQSVRFEIALPDQLTGNGISVISPDGSKLAFVATGADGIARLWIRRLDVLTAKTLDGTDGIYGYPFWSADSRFLAFSAQGRLKKIAAAGGPADTICETSTVWGGAWNRHDQIIFGTTAGTLQVPASGGSPSVITDGGFSVTPSFLPDGHHFVYLRTATNGSRAFGLYLASIDTKPQGQPTKPLLPDYTFVAYAPSSNSNLGYLVFVRGAMAVGAVGTLMAQPFDGHSLKLVGDAIPIAEQISNTSLSVSATDVLAYASGEQELPASLVIGNIRGKLAWVDRQGKIIEMFGDTELYRTLSLSPDGKRVAFEAPTTTNFDNRNIWLYEFARGVKTRFTFDQDWDVNPVWSPDGSQIAFASNRNGGAYNLYRKLSNLAGEDQLLFKSDESKVLTDWSPDGRFLLYNDTSKPSRLWLLPIGSGAEEKPVQLGGSQFNQAMARFSPNGHWIAYSSDESGRDEIYVRRFEAPSVAGSSVGGKSSNGNWMLSRSGGTSPLWRRDGKELFFLSPDGTAMSVEVNTNGVFQAGIPKTLFKVPAGVTFWDVASDGKRFLIPAPSAAARPFTVVMNWQAALKK